VNRSAGPAGPGGFPGPAAEQPVVRRVEKPWGHEFIWAETDRYAGKILVIEAGRRLSLQYHRQKLESILVVAGRLRLHLEDATGVVRTEELGPGAARLIPVGRQHRYEAIERVELFEVSSPELDDVVRISDDFGREGTTQA
jgi:mannose-6-phosphate isomerase